jgi:molybdopterin-binding protein
MSKLRAGQVADLLGVSVDTVRRWADSGRFPTTRDRSGQRVIDSKDVAKFLEASREGPEVEAFRGQSARNQFTGIVTRVIKDKVMAQVEIQSGPHRIVSLMSREAADELALAPGVLAAASVKATNVVIELPA